MPAIAVDRHALVGSPQCVDTLLAEPIPKPTGHRDRSLPAVAAPQVNGVIVLMKSWPDQAANLCLLDDPGHVVSMVDLVEIGPNHHVGVVDVPGHRRLSLNRVSRRTGPFALAANVINLASHDLQFFQIRVWTKQSGIPLVAAPGPLARSTSKRAVRFADDESIDVRTFLGQLEPQQVKLIVRPPKGR